MTMTNKFPVRHRGRPLIAGAIFVSVFLNLFLVGIIMDIMFGHKERTHFGPMSLAYQHGELMEERMTRNLSPADAAIFHTIMLSQLDALKQAHMHVHEATKDLAASYEQDPPNPAATQTALDHLKQAKDEVSDVVSKIVIESNEKLSPDARHLLAAMTQ